jgi:hypothetical protein
MTSTITTGSIPRLLQDGVKSVFGNSYKSYEDTVSKLYTKDTSKKAYEVDVQMEGFGLASEKTEGDDITFDSRRQGFAPKYVHAAYAKGFIVTREALADELYGQLKKGASSLARAMAVTKETRAAALFNTAFSTTSAMAGADGVSMINTAHGNGPSGGTFSNRLAIDADFSEAALEDMLKLIMRAKDSRGLPIKLRGMTLVGHTDLTFDFQRVLKSELQNDTANNAINAVRSLGLFSNGFVTTPFLDANPKSWFIITDAMDGLKFYEREALEFDQDMSFTSKNVRFSAYERYSFGYSDPRAIFGTSGV